MILGFNKRSQVESRLVINVGDELCGCLPKKWRKFFGSSDEYQVKESTDKNDFSKENVRKTS